MMDPLFARAQLAIEESATIRQERRLLHEEFGPLRDRLRLTMLESAMLRSEVLAHRQNHDGEDARERDVAS
ncbi:protein of unknown function [Bradyrhizobium sp. ORS 285]|uniref:hypothetical protein n=1 Tax=Bradyrhizobium sp. ORS 285 TaxID=115808 RepID=UPI0002F0742D|nr:hypothetical protein [Bradyrhizobium sp. ORS 285]SMX59053.1 protein of unknown function [Bradyrhizobium sp. ORS 285]